MGLVIESTTDTTETTGLSLFIPTLQPGTGTDRIRVLTQRLAIVFTALLGTDDPLVVTIPAMQGLVGVRETVIAGSGTSGGDHVQSGLFFLVQFRWLFRKDLLGVCELQNL
jgi:hypothetical protein